MAAILPPPPQEAFSTGFVASGNNITTDVLTQLVSKLDGKAPQVTTQAIEEDAQSVEEQVVTQFGEVLTTVVCDHAPVRSVLHKETIHLREDMQLHLRSVMKTGDDMLTKVREIVEKLDIAVHERSLAESELQDSLKKQKFIQENYERISKEASILRIRLYEMSKARDRAEIDLEAVKGHLLEKEEQCRELERCNKKLSESIGSLKHTLIDYTERLAVAETKVRGFIRDIIKYKDEIEAHKQEKKALTEIGIQLGNDLAQAREELKIVSIELEKVKVELIAARERLVSITIEIEELRKEVIEIRLERDAAFVERDNAYEDRRVAIEDKKKTDEQNKKLVFERDGAIARFEDVSKAYIRDSKLLVDVQRDLNVTKQREETLKREKQELINQRRDLHHLRDEAIEQWKHIDREFHILQDRYHEHEKLVKKWEKEHREMKNKLAEAHHERDTAIHERIIISDRLEVVDRELVSARARLNTALEQVVEAQRQLAIAVEEKEDMEDKWQNAELKLAEVTGELRATVLELESLRHEHGHLREDFEKAQASNKKLTTDLETATASLKDIQEVYGKLKVDYAVLNGKFEELTKDLSHEKQLHTETQKNLTERTNMLTDANKKLETANKNLSTKTKELETMTGKYNAAQTKLDAIEKARKGNYKEVNGVLIRRIYYGSMKVTDTKVFNDIIESWTKNKPFKVTNDSVAGGHDPDKYSTKFMTVCYTNKGVEQTPFVVKEGDSKIFKPKSNNVPA